MRRIFSLLIVLALAIAAMAKDPTATSYSYDECMGSSGPYPAVKKAVGCPDSLKPVMINHVGRHGARYAASPKKFTRLREALVDAQSKKKLTKTGAELLKVVDRAIALTANRWGALDTLGMAEQRGIASRMYARFDSLLHEAKVEAYSSYSPRCIMSMYEFAHQLSRLDNKIEIVTSSGRINSPMLRFFDDNAEYDSFVKSDTLKAAVKEMEEQVPFGKMLDRIFLADHEGRSLDIAMDEYSVLAGLAAIGYDVDLSRFMSAEEINAMWAAVNFKQYLHYSSSVFGGAAAEMASPLLRDIITSIDAKIADPQGQPDAVLRFGHAETLLPLYALMRLPGGYYLTNYFDTVALHWKNFDLVPMAANIQFILLSDQSGKLYLRVDVNESPVALIPGTKDIYVPWSRAREYLERCVPLYF